MSTPKRNDTRGAKLAHTLRDWKPPLGDLVTMRMIGLFSLLRRGGGLAQRRQFDLTELEWRIVTQVGAFAPLSLTSLADLNLQDAGQMSRAVKALVARGLLIRERKRGGPEVQISLTADGQALYARMVERVIERDRRLTQDMAPDDVAALRRLIDLMIVRAEEMLTEELALES